MENIENNLENTQNSVRVKREKLISSFTQNFKVPLQASKFESEIKSEILTYIKSLSDNDIEIITEIWEFRKGDISQYTFDASTINEMNVKINADLFNIAKKYIKI